MKTTAIHGKILALLRELKFREVPDGYVRRFFTRSRIPPLPGMGLEWWLTPAGLNIRNELARMVVAALPDLSLKVDFVAEKIEKILEEHGDDSRLFQSFAYHRADSLLSIAAVPEAKLAEVVWQLVEEALRPSVTEWIVVVPLHRIRAQSVDIGFDGLSLVRRDDVAAWRHIAADFENTSDWDPRTGVRDEKDPKIFRDRLPDSWCICRALGTEDGVIAIARGRFRTFIALLFALEYPRHAELLLKTSFDPPNYAVQFASIAARMDWPQRYGPIGALVPQSVADIDMNDGLLRDVRNWYTQRDNADAEHRRRATVASHFVHFALIADDLERFIHFFVALDALFGERGRVEATVSAGVERIFREPGLKERASKLFDLRSELLHGGASAIEDWSWYENYRRHFRSEPSKDVAVLALTSLVKCF